MLTDILFPKSCLGCGRSGAYICKLCLAKQRFQKQRCIACEKPSIDGVTHFKCKKKLMLDGVVSIWAYEGVVRKCLLSLKYKFAYQIAKELAQFCSLYLKNNFTALPKNTFLTVVPLHKSRENWRGFNQSGEIGKLIAMEMGWKYIPDLAVRKLKTIPQAELPKKEDRKVNLFGAFEINPKYHKAKNIGGSVVVFDDVATTGSTLKEVGKVLKRAGFEKVWGLTAAR